jgi:flagellar basal-body rod protein FlgG
VSSDDTPASPGFLNHLQDRFMLDSLYIGATGLRAQQLNVDTISNNLANINTPGFKRSRVHFDDVVQREVLRASNVPGQAASLVRMGSGVDVTGVRQVFTMGELKKTDDPFNVAIKGMGFLEVLRSDGSLAYSRVGRMKVDQDGMLATADGHPLSGLIRVPPDAKGLNISPDGVVSATYGTSREPEELGVLELVQFANPGGLTPLGEGLYRAADAAGVSTRSRPGQDDAGELAQGYLESSNVALVDEMVGLMVAQRAYEVSAKVIQASDEMLAISNNLRR